MLCLEIRFNADSNANTYATGDENGKYNSGY